MDFTFASLGPALHWLALVVIIAFAIVGLAIIVVLAALPGRIAAHRDHPQAEAINICGWVGLPTGFFWIAALVWAFLRQRSEFRSDAKLADRIERLESAVTELERRRQEPHS